MQKLTLAGVDPERIRGRRVLVRVDYNVPLDSTGEVADDTRIRATIPTLERLIESGARIILLSHFGRPKGKPVATMSLRPAAERLAELIGRPVGFVESTTGENAQAAAGELADGDILLLENTRFDPGEEANDPALAKALSELGDIFVNDAFGAAHRAHASTAGVAEQIRAKGGLAIAGLLMQRELEFLGDALESPVRPFVGILGGAKISGKIDVIEALLPKTDSLLIGGAMANTFFRAMGHETGTSLIEEGRIEVARDLLQRAGDQLVLPVDVVIAERMEAGTETRRVRINEIPAGWMALDIGPETIAKYGEYLARAGTVLWNGPMGVAEVPEFRSGTEGIARALADATARGAVTVVGGGDSAAALHQLELQDRVSHVSTGGGASLEFLEGKALPGIEALSDRREE